MPTVPTYDNYKTTPTIREGRFDSNAPAGQLSLPGRMQEQAGATLGQAGATLGQAGTRLEKAAHEQAQAGASLARVGAGMEAEGRQTLREGSLQMEAWQQEQQKAKQQADTLRVDDALNQAKEAALKLTFDPEGGYTHMKGIAAMPGPDGKALADVYSGKLKDSINALSEGLGNDEQKQLFAAHANDLVSGFYGDALRHESQQFQTYALSVREGTIKTSMDSIGLHWNEPDKIDQSVRSIQASAYELSRLQGKSAVEAESNAKRLTSSAHMQAIGAAIQADNISYAEGYLKQYAGQMEADDILKVKGVITKEMDSQVALGVSNAVVQQYAPQIMPDDFQRAWNIAIKTESGGHQFGKDGQPLLSSKGAVGIAQVMPGTAPEAAKLAGLPWDENRYRHDPAYNEALGKAYFQKQLQDFGGELGKAYAAYNAGPGAVQKAVKAANKAGSPDWLSHMPAETQAYVAKNVQAFNAGGGAGSKPTLFDIHNRLRQEPALANNPARLKLALDDSERQLKEIEQAQKQQAEGVMADAYGWLVQNGGNYSAMPPLLKASVPAEKQDDLLSFAKRISAKEPVETDWTLYAKLYGDRDELAKVNLEAYQDKLAPTEFKQLVQRQDKLNNAEEKEGTYLQSEDQYVNTLLNQGGIDTTPKDAKGWERLGKARTMLQQDISTAEHDAGRKLKREEKDKIIAQTVTRMLGKVRVEDDIGYWDRNVQMIDLTDEQKAKITPSDADRKAILALFKAKGIQPTEKDILNVFHLQKGL